MDINAPMDHSKKKKRVSKMQIKERHIFPLTHYLLVAIIALMSSGWCVIDNKIHGDIISTLVASHLSVLVSQSLLLVLMMWQVLTYKPISTLITVRKQSEYIQKQLLKVVIAETILYFCIYYGLFMFNGIQFFHDGSFMMGTLLLVLRFFIIAILAIIIVGAYRYCPPWLLTIGTLLISLGYHYILEAKYLLLIYSPIYDPLYRAIHRIYRG